MLFDVTSSGRLRHLLGLQVVQRARYVTRNCRCGHDPSPQNAMTGAWIFATTGSKYPVQPWSYSHFQGSGSPANHDAVDASLATMLSVTIRRLSNR